MRAERIVLMILVYGAAILGVTAYAVFWLDRSGWWFLLAIILAGGAEFTFSEKKDRP
ncbi:hypothetical protein [Kaistia nematophila]|uniref:Uncharacterized protein n=1 Tax=Kaistia nematophila TaxID=2994654 RepID=A0A9X3E2S4_9HYPH|nr:hypothetical protein [Kaistia nematophila]MCX5570585.1 hypothetical protein [Kaistia nematophila]